MKAPMKTIFSVVLLASLALGEKCHNSPLPNKDGWCDCSGNVNLAVKSLAFTPATRAVKPGDTLSYSVTAFDNKDYNITAATVTEYIELNDKKIAQGTYDLCAATGACPFAPRTGRAFAVSQTIPAHADAGKYVSKVQVHDQNGHELSCVLFDAMVSAKGEAWPAAPVSRKLVPAISELFGDDCCLNGNCCIGVTFCCAPCDGTCSCCH